MVNGFCRQLLKNPIMKEHFKRCLIVTTYLENDKKQWVPFLLTPVSWGDERKSIIMFLQHVDIELNLM